MQGTVAEAKSRPGDGTLDHGYLGDSVFRGRRGTTFTGGEAALAGFRAGRAGGRGGFFCVQASKQGRQGDTNGLTTDARPDGFLFV